MKPVYFAHEITQMDENAVEKGVAMESMINAAGTAVADMIQKTYPSCSVLFFCGPGHNGADGLAAARMLCSTNGVTVLQFLPDKIKDAARIHRDRLIQTRVHILDVETEQDLIAALEKISDPAVVVDALLGVGSSRAPEGVLALAVDCINAFSQKAKVIAVDLPTGTMVDCGKVYDKTVQAHHTIAMMGYKPAHLLYPAAQYSGGLRLAIPYPQEYTQQHPMVWFQNEDVKPLYRNRGTHKGNYGCLMVVAGSRGYSGAAEMCARSALRSGCGTLVLCAPESTADVCRVKLTEAMTFALPETEEGGYDRCKDSISKVLQRANACAIGPGMGDGVGVMEIVETVLKNKLPVVLDADALNAMSRHGKEALYNATQAILTPHPRELSRLLNVGTAEILSDPIGSANKLAQEYGCVCVLKMASTVIASPDQTAVTTTGCAGMAKGGSGDVLTGCIGALLAQGMDPFYAACFAAHSCGLAGQMAQRRLGMTSMLPTDTIAHLSRVFKKYER